MFIIETEEHISAFNAADRVVGHDRDRQMQRGISCRTTAFL